MMIRSSLLLSFLTAICATESSTPSAPAIPPKSTNTATLIYGADSDRDADEKEQVQHDAQLFVGKELRE